MSNVKKGKGSNSVPGIYKGMDSVGECKYPPDTIHSQMAHAKGKAKMNFAHPPLAPEMHYVDKEEGEGKDPKTEHRSTSGVPGHTLTGN